MSSRAQLAVGVMTVALLTMFAIGSATSDRMPLAGILGAMAALRAWLLWRQWQSGRQPHRSSKR